MVMYTRSLSTRLTLTALVSVMLLVSRPAVGEAFEVTGAGELAPAAITMILMRQPFFGVTHLHTGLSFDASIRFVDEKAGNNPRGAYAFAKGESSITLPNIIGIKG